MIHTAFCCQTTLQTAQQQASVAQTFLSVLNIRLSRFVCLFAIASLHHSTPLAAQSLHTFSDILHPVAGIEKKITKASNDEAFGQSLQNASSEMCDELCEEELARMIGNLAAQSLTSPADSSVAAIDTANADIPKRPFRYTLDGSLPRTFTQLDPLKTALVGGGFTAILGGLQIYQYNAFWSDRTTFRIIDDGDLEYGADKGGHMFAAYTMSKLATDALMTSGFSHDLAVVSGGLIGAGYQFFVEVQDGFGRGWGFSPSDVYANTAGSVFHIMQHFIPFFSNIHFKGTYFPAPWMGEKTRKGASTPIDDYSAWTWWFSFDIHGMLPQEAQSFWPPWLNISVGYAARNLEWADASRRYILSVDYNLEKLLPDGSPFWNWLRQYLNIIKLPAPALEFAFAPDGKLLGPPRLHFLFPFKIASIQF